MKLISNIDKDRNGYVTSTELDDILKICCKKLESYNLVSHMKKFASLQN